MEGSNHWKKRFGILLGSTGLMLLGTPSLRAELLCSTVSSEVRVAAPGNSSEPHSHCNHAEFRPFEPAAKSPVEKTPLDRQAALRKLRQDWEEVHAELTRIAVETTMTMLLIRWGTTPPPDPTGNGNTPPPGGGTTPPPPPPSGQGGNPPPGGGIPPPPPDGTPSAAPEPASVISALLGTGLASLYGWRKRRRNRPSNG